MPDTAVLLPEPASDVTYQGADLEALSTLRRYREWIIHHFQPFLGGRAVEFGAGIGNIAQHLRDHVDTLDLVEPSPNLLESLRRRFDSMPGVALIDGTLERTIADMPDATYDCVVMVNVLEHIEGDIAAVAECRRILKPGGHLLLLVPALPFLYSELDRLAGHYRRYDRKGLLSVLADGGVELRKICYFDFLGIWPWWILNTLCGATTFNPALVRIYDAVFVPIARFMERHLSPPIGKNLVAVARRPEA
jgi:SAM-dependent methyltransferase